MKNKILVSILGAFLLVGLFYFFRAPVFQGKFSASDSASLLPSRMNQDFAGLISVNLDEDPEEEILIASFNGSNRMLKQVNGKFVELNVAELADSNGSNFSLSSCDLNQDGRDEILFINHASADKASTSQIYRFKDGIWTGLLAARDPLRESLNIGFAAACIDRKGNGVFGFAVSIDNGHIKFLEEQNGVITDIAASIGLGRAARGRSILGVPGPQGFTNIFQGNEGGTNFYFINDGHGSYVSAPADFAMSDASFDARGASLMDENHDDLPDLIYGNHYGPSRVMRQMKDGTFKDVTPEAMQKSYAVNALVAQDLNLDGDEDIYGNIIRGSNSLFVRDGKEWFSLIVDLLQEKDLYGIATLTGDLDGKPGIEILNTHGDGAEFPLTLYSVKAESDWLKIHLRSKLGGVLRGSTIIVKTSKRELVKVQSSGTGRFGELHPDLVFGLHQDEKILSVEVITPDGKKTQKMDSLEKNSIIKITI